MVHWWVGFSRGTSLVMNLHVFCGFKLQTSSGTSTTEVSTLSWHSSSPSSKVVKTVQSKIDVKDILNTRLYEANNEEKDFLIEATKKAEKEKESIEAELEDCCKKSVAKN